MAPLPPVQARLYNAWRAPSSWMERLVGRADDIHHIADLRADEERLELHMPGRAQPLQTLRWTDHSIALRWSHHPQSDTITALQLDILQRPLSRDSPRVLLKTLGQRDALTPAVEEQHTVRPYLAPDDFARLMALVERIAQAHQQPTRWPFQLDTLAPSPDQLVSTDAQDNCIGCWQQRIRLPHVKQHVCPLKHH